MYYKRSPGEKFFQILIYIFFVFVSICFVYPVIYCVSMSLSDAAVLGGGNITLLPVGFTFSTYKYIFREKDILRYYLNSIIYAVSGTALSLFLHCITAYPLSEPDFVFKKPIMIYFLITMFFGGGLIPTYLLISSLGLIDTIWALILPGVSAWNLAIYRTFFMQLPNELKDAAKIDGAGHMYVLFLIVVPLSMPLLATMTLFSMVSSWNGYFGPLIYLRSPEKYPIQLLLRSMLVTMAKGDWEQRAQFFLMTGMKITARTLKCAVVVITIAPIMLIYPFLQKYFAKGVLIGSLKG